MAKQAVASDENPGFFGRITNYYGEVRTEMDKVTWPTREDLQVSTKVCLMLLVAMAGVIFFFDQVFQFIVLFLFSLGN